MKVSQSIKRAIAIGVVGAMAICEILPASAAPVLSSTVLVKAATPDVVDQVRYYRRAIGPAIALGVLGAVAGAALQNQNYYSSGYYGSGYYGPGYYGGYGGPGYYGPSGAYPYPYGYNNYGYGYGYDRSGAVAAGAALGAVGAIIGAASRNPRAYRWGRYQYHDPLRVW
ncbi:MAG: hypothetical protein ACXWKC_04195 [Xanthobacteraceae bacterium]